MNRNQAPRNPVQSGEGSYILHFTVAAAAFAACCWPYLIWHGIDQSGGWVWDTSSWTACLLWWLGVSLLFGVIAVLVKANSPAAKAAEQRERDARELSRMKDRYLQLRLEEMRYRQGLRKDDLRAQEDVITTLPQDFLQHPSHP